MQKMAVLHGGGVNHRCSLSDAVLIKENHVLAAGSVREALEAVSHLRGRFTVEIEVRSMEEFRQALAFLPDVIMLDNMDADTIKEAVKLCNKKVKLEISGGISEKNVLEFARTGVDYISVGALTHSVEAADISFLFEGLA